MGGRPRGGGGPRWAAPAGVRSMKLLLLPTQNAKTIFS